MAFRMEQLTIKAQEAVAQAQHAAVQQGHPQVEALHLLAGLLSETDGIVRPLLQEIGIDQGQLDATLESELGRLPKMSGGAAPTVSQNLAQVLEAAVAEAKQMTDEFVSTDHLMLALTKVESPAQKLLQLNGVEQQDVLKALVQVRGSARVTDDSPEAKFQALEKYGIDLVERAKSGKLDPVIGRDSEIRRVIQVLSRRTKNNPVLIGEPGVGKNRDR